MIFVTSNKHKFQEISRMMEKNGITVEWKRMKYEEIQADTTEEISLDSARKLSASIGEPFFLEDTGIFVDSLGGFPGPYSSYVISKIGNSGILRLLEGRGRSAYFLTVITYFDGRQYHQFSGKLTGQIAQSERGGSGFGYDPIFIPDGFSITLGEMDLESKNEISHRSKALRAFIDHLRGNGGI